jgi:hypothetical protein
MAVLLSISRFSPVRGNGPSVQAAEPDRFTQEYTLPLPPDDTRVRRVAAAWGHGSIMMSTRRSVTVGSFEPVCPMGSCWISVRAIPSASS